MSGSFGNNPNEDGAITFTSSSAKSGIFARNDSTDPANAPGGSGVFGLTVALGAAGVFGANNSTKGVGVQGNGPDAGISGFSPQGNGVRGISQSSANFGIFGSNDSPNAPTGGGAGGAGVFGLSVSPGASGVFGANNSAKGVGVQGNGPDAGISGFSPQGTGVRGISQSSASFGIFGSNDSSNAPTGGGAGGAGVFGLSVSPGAAGVFGSNNSAKGVGVQGNGPDAGVSGFREQGTGVLGRSSKNGVTGQTNSNADAGVNGRSDGNGFGVFGGSLGGSGVEGHSTNGNGVVGFSEHGLAGRFIGDVEVTGDIRLANADCAEDFNIGSGLKVEPGTVMVLGEEGALFPSQHAYDKRVAGVISGAGDFKPGIVLDKQQSGGNRQPIALLGKVYCKVDAQYGAIEVGDMLTTSSTPGHAMKVDDPLMAFGAVIGKALRPLSKGQGLIPILIALQ